MWTRRGDGRGRGAELTEGLLDLLEVFKGGPREMGVGGQCCRDVYVGRYSLSWRLGDGREYLGCLGDGRGGLPTAGLLWETGNEGCGVLPQGSGGVRHEPDWVQEVCF